MEFLQSPHATNDASLAGADTGCLSFLCVGVVPLAHTMYLQLLLDLIRTAADMVFQKNKSMRKATPAKADISLVTPPAKVCTAIAYKRNSYAGVSVSLL